MNWFTNGSVRDQKHAERLFTEGGGCEHVEKDISLAAYWSAENDSLGRETYVYCKECWEKAQQEEDEEEECCFDCGKMFPRKDTIAYKWYGFYAPQGDEPLIICKDCKVLPKHLSRLARDRSEREEDERLEEEDDDIDLRYDVDEEDWTNEPEDNSDINW